MTTSRPNAPKPDSVAPPENKAKDVSKPRSADKPAGQPALKGPLDKPRTA